MENEKQIFKEGQQPSRVLASWKEIAAYLKVSVRTAQAWEEERGLPVQRRGTGRRARVVAFCEELDRWSLSTLRETEHTELQTGNAGGLLNGLGRRPMTRIFLPLLLAAAALATYFLQDRPPGFPERVEILDGRIRVYDADSGSFWEAPLPGMIANNYYSTSRAEDGPEALQPFAFRLQDLDGDGTRELLFNFSRYDATQEYSRLICFEADGSIRWEFHYGRSLQVGDRIFPRPFWPLHLDTLRVDDRTMVLAIAVNMYYPAQVVLLDGATGLLVDEYWHPGHIHNSVLLHDLDGDGVPELLLGGINNPEDGLGHPALAILKIPFHKGAPPPGKDSAPLLDFFGFPACEWGYALFPSIDAQTEGVYHTQLRRLWIDGDNRIWVETGRPAVDDKPGGAGGFVYALDAHLRLLEARPSDGIASRHRELLHQGKLDHDLAEEEMESFKRVITFPTAPDGNSPQVRALFAPRK